MLLKVTVNGTTYLVDAETKAAAKKFGASKLEVTVEDAKGADLEGVDPSSIPVVTAKKAAPAAPAEGAEAGGEQAQA